MPPEESKPPVQKPFAPPPPLVAIAAWAMPGLGHILIGQKARGITIGLTILLLFAMGVLIGGIRIVDPPNLMAVPGNPVSNLLAKPWYIGQFLAGLPGVICGWVGARFPQSHARMMEIGTLYTAVAGMLNLMAVLDASFRAAAQQEEAS